MDGADNHALSDHSHATKKAKHTQENNTSLCGGCGENGHKAAVCYETGVSGWMEACCKCDSMKHAYDKCPDRRQEEDFTYLILNRGNKSPVKCSLNLGQVVRSELCRQGSPYKDDQIVALPYSPIFAKQAKLTDVDGAMKLFINGELVKDNRGLSEPSRNGKTLGSAVSILRNQFWTRQGDGFGDEAEKCDNCGLMGHSIYNCFSPCGFCGSEIHQTMSCDVKHNACLCKKYPRHSRYRCDQICSYCSLKNSGKGEPALDHPIWSCPLGCHYCLAPAHRLGQCHKISAVKNRECSKCPAGTYHLPFVHIVCPVANCQSRLKCTEHCCDCGWELSFDKILEREGLPKHTCQWKQNFDALQPHLFCNQNPGHRETTAADFVTRRLETVRDLLNAAVMTATNKTGHPIECKDCLDDLANNSKSMVL
ncbi:hypothetical protein F5X97DRAFT_346596 [Nemania serpens]|nr:hypothetical protein F5X97DRAFT_346596 [Nemania serpens]